MNLKLPHQVRATLYIATLLGTPLVMHLVSTGFVSEDFLTFWSAEVMAVSALAAFNVKGGKG